MKKTKVYMGKLPKSCVGCKYFAEHRRQCELKLCLQWNEVKFKFNDCPLKSLHEYKKELVAKVLNKVRKELDGDYNQYRINHILDQIQEVEDNNVVAFYCNNCRETVLNCEHNFEQLHEKGLCAKCLKKQNKPTISKMESVDEYLCKWQKLKEWLRKVGPGYMNDGFFDCAGAIFEVIDKVQELEKGEKDGNNK